MTKAARILAAAGALMITTSAFAQTSTSLFKIVSVKDELVIGLNGDELAALGGNDAGAVAKALAAKGTLSVWQYAVRKASNGDLEQAPRRRSA